MPITIDTIVKIAEDRRLVVQLPADVPVGNHHVLAVIDNVTDESGRTSSEARAEWSFPVLSNAQWPIDMPLTRAEMYDDDGR